MLYDLIKGVVTIAVCVSFTLALFTLVKVIRCVAYLTYVDRVKGKRNNLFYACIYGTVERPNTIIYLAYYQRL